MLEAEPRITMMILFRKTLTARTSKPCALIGILSAMLLGGGFFGKNAKQAILPCGNGEGKGMNPTYKIVLPDKAAS
jgi:hypothetical protein